MSAAQCGHPILTRPPRCACLHLTTARHKLGQFLTEPLKAVREFGGYIATNQQFIPDYGDRYRNDETITTSFVESAVNQVVSKRFVKA